MKFSFIGQVAEEQRQLPPGVRFPVVFMCRMLEVTRQGYYEWKKRPVSAHDQKDAELAARIRYLHEERHKNRAGIERILWDLQEEGHVTSERRVRRLARAAGLQCVHPGPSARTTMQDSKAIGGLVDLVDREFTAPEPDQLWVGDITYIWTYSGFAYLATLIDMCSNKVVGWAVDDHMRTGLVLEALDNALAARGPGIGIGELVVHHDRGSQYTSGGYRDRLFAEGIIPSVGHTGICYDNAAAESFNATIKKELIYQHGENQNDANRNVLVEGLDPHHLQPHFQHGQDQDPEDGPPHCPYSAEKARPANDNGHHRIQHEGGARVRLAGDVLQHVDDAGERCEERGNDVDDNEMPAGIDAGPDSRVDVAPDGVGVPPEPGALQQKSAYGNKQNRQNDHGGKDSNHGMTGLQRGGGEE